METTAFSFVNDLIMWGVLVFHGVIIVGFFELVVRRGTLSRFVENNALTLAWGVVATSLVGSFYYSMVVGFAPCALCVYQRWLMIALFIIITLALYRNDRGVFPYVIGISVAGLITSVYHMILPMLPSSAVCVIGEVSCTTSYVTGFGYITIPVMSCTVFVAILLIGALQKGSKSVI